MKLVKGDLIKLAKEGKFDLIVHGCNCFCTMGAGIAKEIKREFPLAYTVDKKTIEGDATKLGTFSWTEIDFNNHKFIIVNGYTQYHWGGEGVLADYNAIRNIFKQIKIQFSGLRIGYPAIGAGLAKGSWDVISKIIDEELYNEDHTFVEFNFNQPCQF